MTRRERRATGLYDRAKEPRGETRYCPHLLIFRIAVLARGRTTAASRTPFIEQIPAALWSAPFLGSRPHHQGDRAHLHNGGVGG